jgi:hypothetical protein
VDGLLQILVELLGLFANVGERRRRLREFAKGAEVSFPGRVLGDVPYCHPAYYECSFTAQRETLTYTLGAAARRYSVPSQQLVAGPPRKRESRTERNVRRSWRVLDCTDGGNVVRLAAHKRDLTILQAVLAHPAASKVRD